MRKTRSLLFDWGHDIPPVRYYNYTGPNRRDRITSAAAAWPSFDDYVMSRDNMGHSNANDTWGGEFEYVGSQVFDSTRFKRPKFNNCFNSKVIGCDYTFTFAGLQKKSWVAKYDSFWFPHHYFYAPSVGSITPLNKHLPVDWTWAQRTAWHEMQPRFEGDISMFNFLLELKDVKELLKLLRAHPLRKLRNFFARKRKLFDPSRPIAEAHLINEFAIKPLLSDIYKITCQINERVLDVQKEYADAGLGRNSRHWSQTVIVDDEGLTYGGDNYYYRALGTAEVQTFTATMEYSYDYSARSPIDAFMRYWGVVPTWEAVWNAIPFSFVLDYFFTIGKSIAAMEKDPNTDVLMRQYCESILSLRTNGYHVVTSNCFGGVAVIDRKLRKDPLPLIRGLQSSLYTRRVALPNKGSALPRAKPPSSKQGRNLAALLRCFF